MCVCVSVCLFVLNFFVCVCLFCVCVCVFVLCLCMCVCCVCAWVCARESENGMSEREGEAERYIVTKIEI